jgi:hypothetical protein
MSAMPGFERDLVAAGRRWYAPGAGRRRAARRVATAAAGLAAAAALAAGVVAVLPDGDPETPAPSSGGNGLTVFNRPATASDQLPVGITEGRDARRVADDGRVGVFVLRGAGDLCIVLASDDGGGQSGRSCVPRDKPGAMGLTMTTAGRKAGTRVVYGIAPDWVRRVQVAAGDVVRVRDNGYWAVLPATGGKLTLSGAAGRSISIPFEDATSTPGERGMRKHYALLTRPATRADDLPRDLRDIPEIDRVSARLAGHAAGMRLWVVTGARFACLVTHFDDASGGSDGCTPITRASLLDGSQPLAGTVTGPPNSSGHRQRVYALLADGSRDVRLERDGRVLAHLPVRDNAVVAMRDGADALTFTGPDGVRRRVGL